MRKINPIGRGVLKNMADFDWVVDRKQLGTDPRPLEKEGILTHGTRPGTVKLTTLGKQWVKNGFKAKSSGGGVYVSDKEWAAIQAARKRR